MEYKNTYNTLDKLIAYLRNREVLNNNDLDNKNIIDFGCGSDFKSLKKRYGKTKEAFLIDRCAESFGEGKFTFVNYEDRIEKLDDKLKNKKFDIIIMCAIIEHLDFPENIINYLKKYLNNNGYFFLTAPSKYSKPLLEFLGYKLGIINKELLAEHKRYYNKNEYVELSKKTNLKLEKFYFFEFKMNTAAILK